MSEEEFEIMTLECNRNLALAIAQGMIDNPNEYLCGLATPEQQTTYYHACLEAAEEFDQRLGEICERRKVAL